MSEKVELVDEEEEFEQNTTSSDNGHFQQFGKSAGIILLILLVVGGGIFYWRYTSAENSKKANIALTRILPLYEMNDYERSLNGDASIVVAGQNLLGLKSIADKYSSTGAGQIAALYAGNCYLNTNNTKEAIKYFKQAMNSNSKLVLIGANAGLAVCRENEGNYAEAADSYEKASNLSDLDNIKIKYSLFAGLCFEKSNNKEKAIKEFKNVLGLGPLSEFAGSAKSGLVRLGTIID